MTRYVRVWRVVKAKFKDSAFRGVGSKKFGGRWNSAGAPVVYCSASLPLAVLELLVHIKRNDALAHYVAFPVDIPEKKIERLAARLPRGWEKYPYRRETIRLGDAWLKEARSPALSVPSALLASEHNILINPLHPDFRLVKVRRPEPVRIDKRLKVS